MLFKNRFSIFSFALCLVSSITLEAEVVIIATEPVPLTLHAPAKGGLTAAMAKLTISDAPQALDLPKVIDKEKRIETVDADLLEKVTAAMIKLNVAAPAPTLEQRYQKGRPVCVATLADERMQLIRCLNVLNAATIVSSNNHRIVAWDIDAQQVAGIVDPYDYPSYDHFFDSGMGITNHYVVAKASGKLIIYDIINNEVRTIPCSTTVHQIIPYSTTHFAIFFSIADLRILDASQAKLPSSIDSLVKPTGDIHFGDWPGPLVKSCDGESFLHKGTREDSFFYKFRIVDNKVEIINKIALPDDIHYQLSCHHMIEYAPGLCATINTCNAYTSPFLFYNYLTREITACTGLDGKSFRMNTHDNPHMTLAPNGYIIVIHRPESDRGWESYKKPTTYKLSVIDPKIKAVISSWTLLDDIHERFLFRNLVVLPNGRIVTSNCCDKIQIWEFQMPDSTSKV